MGSSLAYHRSAGTIAQERELTSFSAALTYGGLMCCTTTAFAWSSEHFKAFHKSLQDKGVDMSKVSVSKSLMVIRAIEKYGAFSKKKKSLKKKFRHKLHLGPTEEEKKQAKDEERNEKIEEEAQKDHNKDSGVEKQNRRGPADRQKPAEESSSDDASDSDSDDDGQGEVQPDMHDGMKKEDMSDKERAERAIALIRSAFSKGLKGEKKEILQDAQSSQGEGGKENTKQEDDVKAAQNDQNKSPE